MKKLSALFFTFVLVTGLSLSLHAAERPDIIHYTAKYLDRALHVTLQWQSANPVTLVRVSAGREAKEVKVDEYDNRRVPGGYSGEVTVNIPIDPATYQIAVPFVLQLEDYLRLKSALVTGKASMPPAAPQTATAIPVYPQPVMPGPPPHGQHDNWGHDALKPTTTRPQGGASDLISKLAELKDKYDLAPSVSDIKVNVTGANSVNFSLKANDDKQLREVNLRIFDPVGVLVQNQQFTGLGRVWEGTSQLFRLSGGTYKVVVQAVDSAGNTSKEKSATFVLTGGVITDSQPLVPIPATTAVTPTVYPAPAVAEQPPAVADPAASYPPAPAPALPAPPPELPPPPPGG